MPEPTETLTNAIRSVTDLWDEPLDEVHDIPQIVNAILASGLIAMIETSEGRARVGESAASERECGVCAPHDEHGRFACRRNGDLCGCPGVSASHHPRNDETTESEGNR